MSEREFELADVAEVVETSRKDEVNKFLKLGWKLFATHRQTFQNDEATIYCLGWSAKLGEPKRPEYPQNVGEFRKRTMS